MARIGILALLIASLLGACSPSAGRDHVAVPGRQRLAFRDRSRPCRRPPRIRRRSPACRCSALPAPTSCCGRASSTARPSRWPATTTRWPCPARTRVGTSARSRAGVGSWPSPTPAPVPRCARQAGTQWHELQPAVRNEPGPLLHERDERRPVVVVGRGRNGRTGRPGAHRPRRRRPAMAVHRRDPGPVRERLRRRPDRLGGWPRRAAGGSADRRPADGQDDHAQDDARAGRGRDRARRRPADRGAVFGPATSPPSTRAGTSPATTIVWLVRSLGQAAQAGSAETRSETVWLVDDATGKLIDSHPLKLASDYQPARLWQMATAHGVDCCAGDVLAFYRVESGDGTVVYEGLVPGGSSGGQRLHDLRRRIRLGTARPARRRLLDHRVAGNEQRWRHGHASRRVLHAR